MVNKWVRMGLVGVLSAAILVLVAVPLVLAVASQEDGGVPVAETSPMVRAMPAAHLQPNGSAPKEERDAVIHDPMGSTPVSNAPLAPTSALTVSILSAPWIIVDHNDPTGASGPVPQVFAVEAVVTNTHQTLSVTDVAVHLLFEDPAGDWALLGGEVPTRTLDQPLAPGEAFHAYWLAQYPTSEGSSFQYTVTAWAYNVYSVTTSHNAYGDPETGKTVKTVSALSTGNSGVTQVGGSAVVGAEFTVTVEYDLGSNPLVAAFGPVGNPSFPPSAYRLLASDVRFFNGKTAWEETVYDRVYFPTLDSQAEYAEATYTFLALAPESTQLCAYAALDYGSQPKYDRFYCDSDRGTIVPVTVTHSLSLTKHVSSLTAQQGEWLTYTIDYTNTSNLSLTEVWVWDVIDTSIASIITATIDPASDPNETTDSIVAWYLNEVPAAGQVGSTGTLTFAVFIDGDGQHLADGRFWVNSAFFGVNEGSLPLVKVATSTVTTTIEAPTIALSKTDGQQTAEQGDLLTTTLRITNLGSVDARGLIITDLLPSDVSVNPAAVVPPATGGTGQTLVWDNQGPIAPGEGVTITIPATVMALVSDGTVLTNTMDVRYQNQAGYLFAVATAIDTTMVEAPVLTVSKSDYPDPVLTGGLLTYTLDYGNNGSAQATNVLITDRVPLSTTYHNCSGSACVLNGGIVSWTVGTVPAGASGAVYLTVRVSETLDTGALLRNEDYGIQSDQTGFVSGTLETTLVNKSAASFDVYAFVDDDGDGHFDSGESGLDGVTVTLLSATTPVTTTDGAGHARFRVEVGGVISVTADLPGGYFRTTPGTVYTDSVLEITQTVAFGYAPYTSTFGVIYGSVFEDLDHDGAWDVGENGLPNVDIASSEAISSPVTTNGFGYYTLRYDIGGTVTITEVNPLGYVSTTPDVVITNAIVGSDGPSPIDFGDFEGIKITGQVFSDTNVSGVWDVGEVGLTGGSVAVGSESAPTDADGAFAFFVTITGTDPITVTETDPPGFISTNAIPGPGMARADANRLRIDSPTAGQVYPGNAFGDVRATGAVTISGYVWNDNGANGGSAANGQWEMGKEPGLSGAIVSLSSGLTQTTDSTGSFLLYGPANQEVVIIETNPSGYHSTNAIPGNDANKVDHDTLVVNPLSEHSTSSMNLFGDVEASGTAVITGTVYDDADENGVFDGAEVGLPGITVTMEISGSPILIAVQTDAAGHYQFAVAPETDVRISSTRPVGGYYPTTPESFVARPATAGIWPNNNFGYSDDVDTAVIMGLVWDDLNGDGIRDHGEPGLAGAVITLNGGSPFTTTGNGLITGTFSFTVTQPGIYALNEENPSGYRSTTPDDVLVLVAIGDGAYVEFGDTNAPLIASVHGTVFDDLDGDGVQDPAELGLPGVIISATRGAAVVTATTNIYGLYSFGLVPGSGLSATYRIDEQDPAKLGYRSTTPDSVILTVVEGGSYRVDFGDTMTDTFSTIMGTVYSDADGNGIQDPTELGIEGVSISLSNGMTDTTDTFGRYGFPITEIGAVQVTETDPAGYHSTTPNSVPVDVTALGQVYRVNFGDNNDPGVSSIFGTVFDDQNTSGVRELIEPPLPGVTVTLSDIPIPQVTNLWGQYTFQIDVTGTYTLTETDPAGYVSTNAIPGDAAVTKVDNNTLLAEIANLGGDLRDNLFADVLASQVITVSGTVWDDSGAGLGTAGNGFQDGAEPWLAGARVSLSSGMQATTGPDGAFLLYGLPGGVITVTETNPLGYVSTGAAAGNNAVVLDHDTLTVSGLGGGATSAGNQFGDVLPADLAVTKSDDHDPVVAGTTLTYTLRVTNNGPSYAQNVILTDTLPAGVTLIGATPAQNSGPNPLVWNLGDLAVGASKMYTVVVTVGGGVPDGTTLTNRVAVASNMPDTDVGDNAVVETTDVTAETDLAVTKSDDHDPVVAGTTLTYTVQVSNHGPSDATGVVVADTLPVEVTITDHTAATGTSFDQGSGLWTVGDLALDASATLTLVVQVDPSARGVLTNTVVVSGSEVDLVEENNVADETTDVTAETDLAVTKSDDPDLVVAGTTLTYTVQVSNHGPSDATGVVVADTLPAEVSITDHTAATGTTFDQGSGLWTVGDLALDASATLTLVVQVDPSARGVLTNTVEVSGSEVDPAGENDTADETTDVTAEADLAVTKSDDPDPVAAGGVLTYTITATNNGPSDARDVSITDTLPAEVAFGGIVSADPPAGYLPGSHQLIWTTPTLASGASASIALTVTVSPAATGRFTNEVVITSSTPDTGPGDDRHEEGTDIGAPDRATIYGYVFYDANGNGVRDAAEAGIPNVTIALNGQVTTTTDADGLYILFTAAPGVHTVVETDPPGYRSTTPNEIHRTVVLGESYRVDFGDARDDDEFASIYGTVFEDGNGNGVMDDYEVGIAGVTLRLDGGITTTTDVHGSYTFSTTVAGVHAVVESDPPGYRSTTPNEVHTEVALGEDEQVDFGDARIDDEFASIYGTVFEDANGNGVMDDDEIGIAGVTLRLDGVVTTTTDIHGSYTFSTTVAGVHAVIESDLPGYLSTTPNEVHLEVALGEDYQVDFGDALTTTTFASIHGNVFEDEDSDGEWDADELGISDVTVALLGEAAAVTDSYGRYVLTTTVAGGVTVVETDPPDYFSTTPNTVTLEVELGSGYQVDFGDVLASICTCPADTCEDDDDATQATELSLGASQTHDFCDDAADWYTFTAESLQVYTITTSAWGQRADTYLALYGQDGQTLLMANDDYEGATDHSSRIVWQAPADGIYYVLVSNRVGLDGCYTGYDIELGIRRTHYLFLPVLMRDVPAEGAAAFTVEEDLVVTAGAAEPPDLPVGIQGVISHTCPDAYEVDDTWEQARPITDVVQVHSFDSNPVQFVPDKDYVWFDMPVIGTITFTLPIVTNTTTLMELHDASGNPLGVTSTSGQLVWDGVPRLRYYLSVSPGTAANFGCTNEVGYRLQMERVAIMDLYLPIVIR